MIILSATAGVLGEAIENWIIDNKLNPSTPEEWERCLKDLLEAGVLTPVDSVDDNDVDGIKKILKDNFDVKEI